MINAAHPNAARSPERASVCAEDSLSRKLSHTDCLAAFHSCTRNLVKLYGDAIARGMSDSELTNALERVIGIMGGSSARANCPSVAYAGAGLRIWADWDWADMRHKPIFEGDRTLAIAREVYGITDPSNPQLDQF